MPQNPNLRERFASAGQEDRILPFIGIYDVFSASVAGKYYNNLFLSGFGFAASYYGLPDLGFITWSDLVAFTQRIRTVLPQHTLLVDIDDGYGDPEVACHVVSLLESVGASGVILEDQKRPRRCGHFNGKELMDVGEFVHKLQRVLGTRQDLFVIARTDAVDEEERVRRAKAFAAAGADAVLIEAIPNLETISTIRAQIKLPIMVNQISGGKSPMWSLSELKNAGVSFVNYSTPCLFAAQEAMTTTLMSLQGNDGLLYGGNGGSVGVQGCTTILNENLSRRDKH